MIDGLDRKRGKVVLLGARAAEERAPVSCRWDSSRKTRGVPAFTQERMREVESIEPSENGAAAAAQRKLVIV